MVTPGRPTLAPGACVSVTATKVLVGGPVSVDVPGNPRSPVRPTGETLSGVTGDAGVGSTALVVELVTRRRRLIGSPRFETTVPGSGHP